MSRGAVQTRQVRLEDAGQLLALWRPPTRAGVDPLADTTSAIRKVLVAGRERIVVAELDGSIVGALHLRIGSVGPLGVEEVVFASHLVVAPEARGRGVAKGLMEAATSWAEEQAIAHVVALSPVSSREGNRFMARLGLAPVATARVAATTALRAKLPVDVPGMAAATRPTAASRQLGLVLAQRRSLRRQREAI